MRHRSPSVIHLTALAIGILSCKGDQQADDPAPPAGASEITVTASDYRFDAPAEVPAGLVTIRLVNQGPSLHHIQLFKFEDGKTLDDFLAGMKGEHLPGWAIHAGGPAPPEVGATTASIERLEPGNYGLICFIPSEDGMPHVMKGMSRALKVVGPAPATPAPEPEADIIVTLVDYDFQVSKPLTAGKHVIRVDNAAPQPHEIAIVRLRPGKKPADFTAWAMKPEGPPPATIHGGLSGIEPGGRSYIEVDLPPGDYGLLCFLPDSKDGRPHFMHGMAKETRIET
jgi:hypothetical protein